MLSSFSEDLSCCRELSKRPLLDIDKARKRDKEEAALERESKKIATLNTRMAILTKISAA
ncbi:hypothetical protein SAMN05421503_0288 [Terribacillus aidingensis]|uniref:Uncharacterized protein n=1 Tax=Terribacillus aidingensis TaxID=586416 RepID=A0A285N119_9BACI|nr:hypothetical protein SAMN05421503_0288 [Terribacillus aidingensis]